MIVDISCQKIRWQILFYSLNTEMATKAELPIGNKTRKW